MISQSAEVMQWAVNWGEGDELVWIFHYAEVSGNERLVYAQLLVSNRISQSAQVRW